MSVRELQAKSEAIRRDASHHHYRRERALEVRKEVQGETREEILAALREAYWLGVEGLDLEGPEGSGR